MISIGGFRSVDCFQLFHYIETEFGYNWLFKRMFSVTVAETSFSVTKFLSDPCSVTRTEILFRAQAVCSKVSDDRFNQHSHASGILYSLREGFPWGSYLGKWGVSEIIPPPNGSDVISVKEGSNVRLMCVVTGKPEPVVQWTRIDGSVIPMGPWHGIIVFCF